MLLLKHLLWTVCANSAELIFRNTVVGHDFEPRKESLAL